MKLFIFLILFSSLFTILNSYAAPYRPSSGDEVLIIIDKSSQRSQFEKFNLQLKNNINNPTELIQILQNTIEYGKINSAPRYIGFATSYINSYLNKHNNIKTTDFKILKARLLQHDHKFSKSITILNNIIKLDYEKSNARLLRASILQVQAKYNLARQDCYSLIGKTSHLITAACFAQIDGLTRNTLLAYTSLNNIVAIQSNYTSSELSWVYDILGQLSRQLGNEIQAENNYKKGLTLSPHNTALLNAYSDLLISKKEYRKVINLLKHKSKDFTVLLRLAIAEKFVSSDTQYATQFRNRLIKMIAISDFTHQREISAFYLYVDDNIEKAQFYARKNWMMQKELYDAQLLLKCAVINNNTEIATPVIKWYVDNSVYDIRLNVLINNLNTTNNAAVRS